MLFAEAYCEIQNATARGWGARYVYFSPPSATTAGARHPQGFPPPQNSSRGPLWQPLARDPEIPLSPRQWQAR